MSDARERQLWLKLHRALCKRPRVRYALRGLTDKQEMALAEEAVTLIKKSGAFEQTVPVCEIEPHAYVPSAMHMGDCQVCGHLQGAPHHSPFRQK